MSFTRYYGVLLNYKVLYWVSLVFTEFDQVLSSFTGFRLLLPSFTEVFQALPSFASKPRHFFLEIIHLIAWVHLRLWEKRRSFRIRR